MLVPIDMDRGDTGDRPAPVLDLLGAGLTEELDHVDGHLVSRRRDHLWRRDVPRTGR